MEHITLHTPLDMHLHLREGEMLNNVAPLTAAIFSGAVIMPNLIEPVNTLHRLQNYRQAVETACQGYTFTPYMTLFFRQYSREELEAVKPYIVGIKLYPAGITTQSESGVSDLDACLDTLAEMEALDIPLLVHGESNGFVMDRETEFLAVYEKIASRFPNLRVVMEHITTAAALQLMDAYPNIGATVTLHHLLLTLDDVVGGLMKPHLFCKPIAKRPEDRQALCDAVFCGHPRLFFGSDSAPHPRHTKECCGCAAGIFSAPVSLPKLTELFMEHSNVTLLQDFVSNNARAFYRITPVQKNIHLRKKQWKVPSRFGDVVPFLAEETLSWSIFSTI
ncbi:dihydroorotase [Desulfogranum japonicum]|uniref:dihydroorotase n=1 Tax=Desulfogranum japonicum TaxID=231447 RepID=UPI0003F5E901|nr:dihydroorotase [Desulfogranum japonicum]